MYISRIQQFAKAGAGVLALGLAMMTSVHAATGSTAAPTFTLPTKSGETVDLAKLKGRVVMLNFWAS